jgi:hypothetical protein
LSAASGTAPAGAVVDLGSQDLREVGQVSLAFPNGDLSHPGGVGADGWQLELARGSSDGGQRGGVGHAGQPEPPDSSWS